MTKAQREHSEATVDKQDMLVEELNEAGRVVPGQKGRFSPRKLESNETARQNFFKLQETQNESVLQLRDLRRQVPSVAIDF